jgi:hypothetical protein
VIAVNGVIEERSVGRKCVVRFDRLGILVDKGRKRNHLVVCFALVGLVCSGLVSLDAERV